MKLYNSDDNTKKTKLQEGNFKPKGLVKVERQGKSYCMIKGSCYKSKQTIKKIDKDSYVVLSTGEIRKFRKDAKTKVDKNLRETFGRLRGLIRHNFSSGSENQLFVTLTYKENMTDPVKLYHDFKNFMKRLKYYYKGKKFEYISVAEPQGRGAWHFHVMLKDTKNKVLFLDCNEVEQIWGHGMAQTERLKSDEIGSYYSSYFTDILDESKGKKKGERLHLYPKGFNFYRCSRGIQKPQETIELLEDVEREFPIMIYEKSYDLIVADEGSETGERVANQFYRAERKKRAEIQRSEKRIKKSVPRCASFSVSKKTDFAT